jgi:hypothetical protein
VYFGKGTPIEGHEANFYNDKRKGPTSRTAPSEAKGRFARDHVIEVPEDT